jgi:hypothetical protein
MNDFGRQTDPKPDPCRYLVLGLLFSGAALACAVYTHVTGEPLLAVTVSSGNLRMLVAVVVSHLPMMGATSLFGSIAFWMFKKMFHFDNRFGGPTEQSGPSTFDKREPPPSDPGSAN